MRVDIMRRVLLFVLVACCINISASTATLSVLSFGARADGESDCTAAFQSALDECARNAGGTVFAPAGRYMFKGHLEVPAYVCLEGTFRSPPTFTETSGTVLLATEGRGDTTAQPFISLNRCSTLQGIEVIYPDQQPETIAEYPWCVRGHGDNIALRDVLLVNPYLGVDFGTFPAGRHFISGLYGMPLKLGLFIDKCFDVGRVENVHFWPFWTEKAMTFTREHGTAFRIAKTDWEYMRDCFCISYAVGYHFTQVNDGPGNAVLTQCGADIGPIAVQVDAVQAHSGISFSNGQFMAGVRVADTNSGPVKFTSCGFWGVEGVTESHAYIAGAGHVSFTACHFTWGDQLRKHAPAIVATSGGLTINGCEFLETAPGTRHIELGADVEAAIIQGNRFRTEPRIINNSEGEVVISGNTSGTKTKLGVALESGDASAISKLWQRRMDHTPLTSAPESLRLASAVHLTTPETAELRRELLRSIVAGTTTETSHFQKRAQREIARDEGRNDDAGPQLVAARDAKLSSEGSIKLGNGAAGTFRVGYDDEALRLSVTNREPRMKRLAEGQKGHDGKVWMDDCVELFVSPRGATDRYYQLIVNAAGAWYDGTGDLRATSSAWDSQPVIRTSRTADSWNVELAFRWADMNVKPPAPGDRWTIDVRRWRFAGGDKEYVSWANAPLSGNTHHPEAFGGLLFQ